MLSEQITLLPVTSVDFEALVELRIAAMRESLKRLGRFDVERARERLRKSFFPEATRFILHGEERIGFYTFRDLGDQFRLDHLYVHPKFQSRGVGSHVMQQLIISADEQQRPIRLGALRESASNGFYLTHGFRVESEDEWDVYYVRLPTLPSPPSARGLN